MEEWTKRLLSVELSWYWESARSGPPEDSSQYTYLPEERSLTLLDMNNVKTFLDDLSERDIDGYARFIAIFGLDVDASPSSLGSAQFRSMVSNFLKHEEGPIRVVVIQIGDSPWEQVYVTHNPIESVRRLLECWEITSSAINRKRPYEQLNTAKLESVYAIAS